MKKWWLSAVLLAAACGDDGSHSLADAPNGGSDGPHGGSDTGPEGPVATKTITGGAMVHYISSVSGEASVPENLSGDTVTGYSLEGASWVARAGAGSADGTFSFPVDESATSWLLGVAQPGQSPNFYATDSTAPDLSEYVLGRPQTFATMDLETTLDLTGMTPWATGDYLQLLIPGNGAFAYYADSYLLAQPAVADTDIDQTFNWGTSGLALCDATMGDELNVLHTTTVTDGAFAYSAVTDIAQIGGVTQVSGQPATFAGAFATVDRSSALALDWRGTDFQALRAATGVPATSVASPTVVVEALPDAGHHGAYWPGPYLAAWSGSANTNTTGTISFANVWTYGKSFWNAFAVYQYEWPVTLQVGNLQAGYYLGFSGAFEVGDPTFPTIHPIVSPPANITLNGAAALGTTLLTGATTTPTFAWSAPTTGTATSYSVLLLEPTAATGFAYLQPVGFFEVPSTSLTVPSGILQQGHTYVAIVSAIHSLVDFDNAPNLDILGRQQADAITAQLTP